MRSEAYVPLVMGLVAILASKRLAHGFAQREARFLSRNPERANPGRVRAWYIGLGCLLLLVSLLLGFPEIVPSPAAVPPYVPPRTPRWAGLLPLACGVGAIAFRRGLARAYARRMSALLGLDDARPAPRVVWFVAAFGALLVGVGLLTLLSSSTGGSS
jgi:hypothetical protein